MTKEKTAVIHATDMIQGIMNSLHPSEGRKTREAYSRLSNNRYVAGISSLLYTGVDGYFISRNFKMSACHCVTPSKIECNYVIRSLLHTLDDKHSIDLDL